MPGKPWVLCWNIISYLATSALRSKYAFCRFLELLQQNRSKCPAVDVSKIKEVTPLPLPDSQTPPVLVMGGDADYSVDLEGLQETGDHYGVQPIILPGLAHDLMLVSHPSIHVHHVMYALQYCPSLRIAVKLSWLITHRERMSGKRKFARGDFKDFHHKQSSLEFGLSLHGLSLHRLWYHLKSYLSTISRRLWVMPQQILYSIQSFLHFPLGSVLK